MSNNDLIRRGDVRKLADWFATEDGEVLAVDMDDIAEIPAVDAKPVVRGKWIDFGDELDKSAGRHSYQCSHCFTDASYFISGFEWDEWTAPHFCPNCGADMRKEVKDE